MDDWEDGLVVWAAVAELAECLGWDWAGGLESKLDGAIGVTAAMDLAVEAYVALEAAELAAFAEVVGGLVASRWANFSSMEENLASKLAWRVD